MTASRLLSVALLLAAFSSSAAAEDCVAAFDSAQSDYRRAQSAQDALGARGGKLDGTLCQGRLDLLDLRFELADRYEVCARDGGTFPPTRPARWIGKPACWLRRNPTGSRSAARS